MCERERRERERGREKEKGRERGKERGGGGLTAMYPAHPAFLV